MTKVRISKAAAKRIARSAKAEKAREAHIAKERAETGNAAASHAKKKGGK